MHIHVEVRHADFRHGHQVVQSSPLALCNSLSRERSVIQTAKFTPLHSCDAAAPEFGETRDLFLERLRRRTEHGETEDQNAILLRRQRNLRAATEYVAQELACIPEVASVALPEMRLA